MTSDFSTLFTKISHSKLLKVKHDLRDFYFDEGDSTYVTVSIELSGFQTHSFPILFGKKTFKDFF